MSKEIRITLDFSIKEKTESRSRQKGVVLVLMIHLQE